MISTWEFMRVKIGPHIRRQRGEESIVHTRKRIGVCIRALINGVRRGRQRVESSCDVAPPTIKFTGSISLRADRVVKAAASHQTPGYLAPFNAAESLLLPPPPNTHTHTGRQINTKARSCVLDRSATLLDRRLLEERLAETWEADCCLETRRAQTVRVSRVWRPSKTRFLSF